MLSCVGDVKMIGSLIVVASERGTCNTCGATRGHHIIKGLYLGHQADSKGVIVDRVLVSKEDVWICPGCGTPAYFEAFHCIHSPFLTHWVHNGGVYVSLHCFN